MGDMIDDAELEPEATAEQAGPVTLVDLSASPERGLEQIRTVGASGGIVLALLPDAALADQALSAGATHLHLIEGGLPLADSVRAAEQASRLGVTFRDRRAGNDALAEWLHAQQAAEQSAALVRIRLLRLDLINTAHGRSAGTALVTAAERRIGSVLDALGQEGEALLIRLPGPSFAAALAGEPDRTVLAAARIEEALDRPFRIGGRSLVLGCRIGLAGVRSGDDSTMLLARADRAAGEEVAEHDGGDRAADARALARDLHRALANGEIALLFQPQAALSSGEVTGVEALARWQHPELGALGAERLFAAAKDAGIALALSDHIQRLVLARVAEWPGVLGHLRVSLNLTPGDLARPGFAETFLDRVDAAGVPRGRLTLEITETGLMADLPGAAALLGRLRGAGCRVAIDDFGTGYSSLAWLKALPVDFLKLDKGLTQDIAGSDRDRVVVRGAIDMARSLGLAVVAEGIETEQQRTLLAAEGCASYQGFLLSEPLSEAELVAFVENSAPRPR